jgi:hypothetical protein
VTRKIAQSQRCTHCHHCHQLHGYVRGKGVCMDVWKRPVTTGDTGDSVMKRASTNSLWAAQCTVDWRHVSRAPLRHSATVRAAEPPRSDRPRTGGRRINGNRPPTIATYARGIVGRCFPRARSQPRTRGRRTGGKWANSAKNRKGPYGMPIHRAPDARSISAYWGRPFLQFRFAELTR